MFRLHLVGIFCFLCYESHQLGYWGEDDVIMGDYMGQGDVSLVLAATWGVGFPGAIYAMVDAT